MVRNYVRTSTRRSTYTSEILERALDEIKRGVITQYGAHKKYNIPQMTLSYHRRGCRGKKSSTMGRSTAISFEEESRLANCLITMEKWGWGLTRSNVFNIVQNYVTANKLKTRFRNGRPGEDWFLNFSKRHNLSIKKPQSVEYARKKCLDPFIINNYFEILKNQLDELNLHDKPRQIWNLDETNFSLDPSKTKIVGKRGAPSSRTTAGSGRENITVLMAVSADGFKAPPLIVFKAKNMWHDWIAPPTESFPGITYATTNNGWMESNVFLQYFEKSLLDSFGPQRPVLLIYDGHASHVDERLIRAAKENDVTILKLPPHSSHLLQPLDLSVFKSLKVKWEHALIEWQRHNEGRKIPKKKFSSLICKIWKETDPDIIINGFKKGGIFPYNPNVVVKEQYDPLSYKRWEQHMEDIAQSVSEDTSQESSGVLQDISNKLQQQTYDVQPGTSGVSEIAPSRNCSFEELLLSTVHQTNAPEKIKKRKVCSGAEVITSDEIMRRLKDKENNTNLSTKMSKKKQKSIKSQEDWEENLEEMIFQDSDDDIEEEMREAEALELCMAEIDKPSEDIKDDDWVLVALAGKKTRKYYVGQIISVNEIDDELEIKYTRKVPTLDPLSSTTFSWSSEETSIVSRNDVILSLPKPTFTGRRGLIKFDINFSAYNVQ